MSNETLHDAAWEGDLEGVRAALAAGADPGSVIEDRSALLCAVVGGSTEVVEALLEAGASFEHEPAAAVYADGDLAMLRVLADKGVALARANADGETALIRSVASHPDPEPVRFLLDAGLPVDQANGDGWTALCFAAQWDGRWDEVIALLRERGADVNLETKEGWTPLLLACHSRVDDKGPARLLLRAEGIDVNRRVPPFGWTPLLKAVAGQYCSDALVEQLLAAGADPNAVLEVSDSKSYRPKHSVLAQNLFGEFKVTKKMNGSTPLSFALKKKRARAAEILCEAGADVHQVDVAGASKKMRAMLAKYA